MRPGVVLLCSCAALLAGLLSCVRQDAGFLLCGNGVEARHGRLPYSVSANEPIASEMLSTAIGEWNRQLGVEAFRHDAKSADVNVAFGDIRWPAIGTAAVQCLPDGTITSTKITISRDLSHDSRMTMLVLMHELGHALGLDDDCGPPVCVDLRSVMADPVDPCGTLTAADKRRLR